MYGRLVFALALAAACHALPPPLEPDPVPRPAAIGAIAALWRHDGMGWSDRCDYVTKTVTVHTLPANTANKACGQPVWGCLLRDRHIVLSDKIPTHERWQRTLAHEVVHLLERCSIRQVPKGPCAAPGHCDPAVWRPHGSGDHCVGDSFEARAQRLIVPCGGRA